ncbi:MAG: mechanosensitive ion channel domain-containing protein [Candidatus Electrothrix sp. GW3-4]|uniref:mechanosensitive ion channel family protein n=1 Tax=Candidatus Electrothrix sp. GW3-4 TaxID=3126740 RepID=UPI0030CBE98D
MNDRKRKLFYLAAVALLLAVLLLLLAFDPEKGVDNSLTLFGIILTAAIAISSTTFISNFMAGMMLSLVSNFRPGDFLSVGEHFGRVTEMGLLHTEIQTKDSDLTTLPNLYLITNPCKVVRKTKTVVSATVSLGYDVPHAQVKTLLTKAAEEVPLQEPFVHVANLGDFSVEYRVAGILKGVKKPFTTRSKLRENILDALHSAGIEIVSPSFMNTRALSVKKHIIPDSQGPDAPDHPAMESVVFDKADEAESIDKMHSRYKLMGEQIKIIEDRIKEADAEEEVQRLQQEVAWRTTSIDRLGRKIEEVGG